MTFQAEFSFKSNVEENTLTLIFSVVGDAMKESTLIQFRRLVLKSPPLGRKWGKCAKKLGCASSQLQLTVETADC